MTVLQDHIELYTGLGFSMIPILPPNGGYQDGKRPAINEWMTYMSRHPTVFEKSQWWPDTTENNIAVVTGSISDLAVLDLDDEQSYRDLLSVDHTYENHMYVTTGKGFHIYFRPDKDGRTQTFLMNNKTHHLKRHGGYVVAAPSKHITGRQYTLQHVDIKPLVIDKLKEDLTKAGALFSHIETKDRPANWASELMTPVPDGQRNTRAAQLCGLLIRKFQYDPGLVWGLMDSWNQRYCNPPLPHDELQNLVKGEFSRYGPR